jgi:hypothetical protein
VKEQDISEYRFATLRTIENCLKWKEFIGGIYR